MTALSLPKQPAGIGIVGCGNISSIYFRNLHQRFRNTTVLACADLDLERAKARAEEFGVQHACTPEELMKNPDISIVVNLTIPNAHYSVCMQALQAGKNAYVEKPLSVDLEQGEELQNAAAARGLRVGGAPDTFLGGGIQTCRKLLDEGWIGEPVAAAAFMMGHGHESWHPDPEFYYKKGGGPMFDMGPYYLTALVNLLGPIKRVTGSTRVTFPERTITSKPKYGTVISVDTPTHIAGVIDFECGAIGTLVTSFDVWSHSMPCIEIYGTEGSMRVPDPNGFGGQVMIRRAGASDWSVIPLTHGFAENERGVGVADMAAGLVSGRLHRASGDLTLHVLEAMHGFHIAAREEKHYAMKNQCRRPAPLPMGLPSNAVDA